MKKLLVALLICFPIMLTFANGTKEGPVTVRFNPAMDASRLKYYEAAVAAFNEKNSQIKVVIENTPWGEYWQKLRAQTASKTEPDVWCYVPTFGDEWLDKGLLLPLDSYIKDTSTDTSTFVQATLNAVKRDGKLYAFPYEGGSTVFSYVNVDLFNQAGVALPNQDWTWDDAKKMAQTIMGKVPSVSTGKVYGFAQPMPVEDWPLATFLAGWGVNLVTNGSGGPAYHINDPKAVQALQWFFDLHAKDNLAAPLDETPKDDWTIWMNGRVPFVFSGTWAIPQFDSGAKFKWDVLPFPKGPQGRGVVALAGYFTISKDTKVPKQAFEFLKYITSEEQNNNIVAKTGAGIPAHPSGFQFMTPELQRASKVMFVDSVPMASFAGMPSIYDVQSKEFQLGMTGQKSAADVAQTVEDAANQIITQNYSK